MEREIETKRCCSKRDRKSGEVVQREVETKGSCQSKNEIETRMEMETKKSCQNEEREIELKRCCQNEKRDGALHIQSWNADVELWPGSGNGRRFEL